MALDEAVLVESPVSALVLRFYQWTGNACTFGYSQPYAEAKAACEARGWRDVLPVRRATGGGIVFHDGDLTFSLVFPWDRTLSPDSIYKNLHRGVHQGLKSRGVVTSLWSPAKAPGGLAASCFSRPERMDLVRCDDVKMLGGALRKKGAKGLYQGSLRPEGLGRSRAELEAAVVDGIGRELGTPATALEPAWLEAGRELELKYRSADWNERR